MQRASPGGKRSPDRPSAVAVPMKQYLADLDPALLRRRMGRFWEHDFAAMSYLEVSNAISRVLTVGRRCVLPATMRTIPSGTQLFRVRHVPRELVPTEVDCWAPPADRATGNRVNGDGEPWLYTSFDLGTAFSEMPIPSGKIAMVMVYKVCEELKCSCPEFGDEDRFNLTRRERLRLGLATQFMRDLFSLEVNDGEEHLYRITQALVTDLVDYPECVAVWYPAVKSHGHHVAIKGPHQRRLRLSSVKMMDSVTVSDSADAKQYDIIFQLLRSYDGNLVENTRAT